MAELTLVADGLAKPGFTFTFVGASDDEVCQECPVRTLCFRIPAGRRYRVLEVRDKTHPCGLHEGDQVRVCTVEEVPVRTSLETKHLRGTAAHWTPVDCGYPECPRYGFCHPVGLPTGKKQEIIQDHGRMECPMGFEIHDVELRRIEE